MIAENPSANEQEIAAKLKVEVTRFSVEPQALSHTIEELRKIRISPVLNDRVAVDNYSIYEFWYDNWQESVHYAITSPLGNTPQDQLGRWMLGFRGSLQHLVKVPDSKP